MINDPPRGWGDMSYGEKESWREGSRTRDSRDERAWRELEEGWSVETPDGWIGFIAEKDPDGRSVYVENWDRAGTYRASQVEPVDQEFTL